MKSKNLGGHSMIMEDDVARMTPPEKNIYSQIEEYEKYKQHYMNRLLYIEKMKSDDTNSFDDVFQRYYKAFDDEMAKCTAAYYSKLSSEKRAFCSAFLHTWRSYVSNAQTEDLRTSIQGLELLSNTVEALSSGGNIQCAVDRLFVRNINELIGFVKEMNNQQS